MTSIRFVLLSLSVVAAVALGAQQPIPAGGGALLSPAAVETLRLSHSPGNEDAAVVTTVPVTDIGFATARRIETRRDLSSAWAVELRTPLVGVAVKGDAALVRFFARSLAAADETGSARLRVVVQKASPDYDKDLERQFTLGREWKEYLVPFAFAHDHAAGAAEISFGVGFKRQTIELGGVELLDFGAKVALAALPKTRFTYVGREPGAAWRRDALARIEQVRKGDFLLRVTDAAGAPVAGATVSVELRRSAFQWGTALQFARLVNDSLENRVYRAKALELFNAASPENDLKWPVWNGDWGPGFEHEQSFAALRWLNEKGLHVRGHVLVWPGWQDLPKSVTSRRGKSAQAEIPELVLAHIKEVTTATKGLLREWDVLNEPYDHSDLMTLFGPEIMTAWFKAARENLPGVPLYLNDYSNHDLVLDADHVQHFIRTATALRQAGAPLGGLGLQGHIGAAPSAPANVLATLDRYAEFKLPIRFTEFDVNTDDEELQADYTRDFLILAFSHPSVVGVQHWGFWEKTHWRPQAAMFRNDWSEKPNAKVYRSLVLDQWHTKLAGATDATGDYVARGFLGDYAVSVEKDGRKAEAVFSLQAGGKPPVIAVKLP